MKLKSRWKYLWSKKLILTAYVLLVAIITAVFVNIPINTYKNASILDQGVTSIRGTSMMPTFNDSAVLYTKPAEFTRGSIVVSQFPSGSKYSSAEDMALLKRIVGLPGEIVEITEDGILIDGDLLDEPYTNNANYTLARENEVNEIILSDNEYFLLGDNRENSFDSRHIGAIKGTLFLYSVTTEPNEYTQHLINKYTTLSIGMFVILTVLNCTLFFLLSSEKFIALFQQKQKKIKVPTKTVQKSAQYASKSKTKKHKKKK